MVTTVTLNPCIDWTVAVPALTVGGLNLVGSSRTDVCGKGINVAEVLKELGCAAFCTGVSFTENGALLSEKLDSIGIPHDFVMAPGRIRTNIKVMDSGANSMTELNSLGDPVEPAIIEAFLDKLEKYAAISSIVTLNGRITKSGSEDIYKRCIERVRDYPVRVILDAEKAPLMQAISAKPYLIKPNLYELETAFGRKAASKFDIIAMCRELICRGVTVVCVSLSEDGAMIVDEANAFHAPAPKLVPKGFQGSGDSMVAGICRAILEGKDIEDMLRYGVAAASASIIREGTLLCRAGDYQSFLPQVNTNSIAAFENI